MATSLIAVVSKELLNSILILVMIGDRVVKVKVNVIGAGSATFSLALIKDLCLTPNLEGSTISLMDINERRLNAVYALCRRYADEMKIKLKIEKTLSREESLKGADFVINTALVVGYSGYREGWNIRL